MSADDQQLLDALLALRPLECDFQVLADFQAEWGGEISNRFLPQYEKGLVYRGHRVHDLPGARPEDREAAVRNLELINQELRDSLGVRDWPPARGAALEEQNVRLLFEAERRLAREIVTGLSPAPGARRVIPPHPSDLFGRSRRAAAERVLKLPNSGSNGSSGPPTPRSQAPGSDG